MNLLVFPSEFVNGMYRSPVTKVYKPFDTYQFYHKGKLHTEAFREEYPGGTNIYLRRTTGELGAIRYKGMFLLNIFCLTIMAGMVVLGIYQARIANHDNPNHAFTVALIVGMVLFLIPAYTVIKHCLYPDAKEFSRWYHRDV
jgi:hypothetical protein